jgi:alkylation response protein AidB-like acyl-CoA dehydrogenase
VHFNLTPVQLSWRSRAEALSRDLASGVTAADVVAGAARAGLVDPDADLLSAAVAVEALACESASAAIAYALHTSVVRGAFQHAAAFTGRPPLEALRRGEIAGAIALAADDVPAEADGRLSGRASWVAPLTARGLVIVGAARGSQDADAGGGPRPHVACAVALDAPGVSFAADETAALDGLVCGHVAFTEVPCTPLGDTQPIMACVRILLAAAGLGMGRRAVRESMNAARASTRSGAGGEQTVQGLVADAATEIDAAKLLTWKAAAATRLSLADASMAKLAATDATQRAVARATQAVGGDSFRRGHIIERLAQDVRALELFAGRTEALREAVSLETLPRP